MPFRPTYLPLFITLALALAGSSLTWAQSEPEVKVLDDLDWPQVYQAKDYEIAVYQPQIHEWRDYITAKARMAIGIKKSGEQDIHYGAMEVEADTILDLENRIVTFKERTVKSLNFPDAATTETRKELRDAVYSILTPKKPLVINLDRLLANVVRTADQERDIEINLDPPPIFYSKTPAILVMLMGKPRLQAIKGTNLFFATNTNWDLFLDSKTNLYFLLNGDHWLCTSNLSKGPWITPVHLPEDFKKLPADKNWEAVIANLDNKKAATIPKVILVEQPSELILTSGEASYSPIGDEGLLFVSNSDQDVFLFRNRHYFLVTGRWFSAETLDGPWEAATNDLPAEFLGIPKDHEKAYVLTSIQGSPEAEEAVIMAQIPQTATVQRDEIKIDITYDGPPKFEDIEGAPGVRYAINTTHDVFQSDLIYYCCKDGIWFKSISERGPWTVCDSVPHALYQIPPSSPKHNVTYVRVYNSTPTTVTTGYTAGYTGSYVAGNILVFGAGVWLMSEIIDNWDDHHWHHWHHHHSPHWYGYGCGAHYDWYSGGYYRSGYRYYGPYGGAGRGAVYNPRTGTYSRGAYAYGPRGGTLAREAYNPWTDTYAGQVKVKTPYGSWGRSVVTRDDEWARAGHRSNWKGTAYGLETSKSGKLIGVDRRYGNDGFIGKTKKDDLYVGRNGNIYKRDSDGGWSHRSNGNWRSVDVPNTLPQTKPQIKKPAVTIPKTRPKTTPQPRPKVQPVKPVRPAPSTRPKVQPTPTKRRVIPSTPTQLRRDHQARQRGQTQILRSRTTRTSRTSRPPISRGRRR